MPSEPAEPVLLPKAVLTRGARLLEVNAAMVGSGKPVVPDIPAEAPSKMADAFIGDAVTLRAFVAEHGATDGRTPDN